MCYEMASFSYRTQKFKSQLDLSLMYVLDHGPLTYGLEINIEKIKNGTTLGIGRRLS